MFEDKQFIINNLERELEYTKKELTNALLMYENMKRDKNILDDKLRKLKKIIKMKIQLFKFC